MKDNTFYGNEDTYVMYFKDIDSAGKYLRDVDYVSMDAQYNIGGIKFFLAELAALCGLCEYELVTGRSIS